MLYLFTVVQRTTHTFCFHHYKVVVKIKMSSLITADTKEEMEAMLRQLIKSYDDKMSLYNDIHHYVDEMVPHKFPDGGEVLPEKEGVLRLLRYNRQRNEVKKKIHERLLRVVSTLPTTTDNPEEGDEDLRGRHHMSGEEVMELFGVNPKRCSRDKRKLDKEGNECNE